MMKRGSVVAHGRTTTVHLNGNMVTLKPRWWAWFMTPQNAPRGKFAVWHVLEFRCDPPGLIRRGWVRFDLTPSGWEDSYTVEYRWKARREFKQLAKAFAAARTW